MSDPEAELAKPDTHLSVRPLHFIFLADCSGSMNMNGRIQALNQAIREALPHMKKAARDNPHVEVLVRAIRFSTGASWHVGTPTPIADFTWTDLVAEGVTDLGKALTLAAEELQSPPMPPRALPPVLVLVTDGEPTDDWTAGLDTLMKEPWGRKAVRIAIAIGDNANQDILQRFIGLPASEMKPLQANNPEALVRTMRWTTQAVHSVASPATLADMASGGILGIPQPKSDPNDVW
jgi:uncharacterized protein YegL